MRACVLTLKSEEARASSASLLATPMIARSVLYTPLACLRATVIRAQHPEAGGSGIAIG